MIKKKNTKNPVYTKYLHPSTPHKKEKFLMRTPFILTGKYTSTKRPSKEPALHRRPGKAGEILAS